ncbi:hypothetical protein NDN08_004860 [Rhodosorus marinus]|uniref:Cleavage/polyadenylation specificity factor A subunit N-terminal domain-containing protein n=1 Tax=Rhodosorus marinus TaxID=101924 RepID=A0AAV8UIW1_9RHOD|nr:hypothetical protein NDN08_004860 [Rhodosorus marinus]
MVALHVCVALNANVVAITGKRQNLIQLNDAETLETVHIIEDKSGNRLFQLISLGRYIYVTSVNNDEELHAELRMYEIQSRTNKLEFVQSKSFGTQCIQPIALTASYDYSDQTVLALTCLETESVMVVNPATLKLIKAISKPVIKDIFIKDIAESAMTARYLYVAYVISPQLDHDFSKGLLVQYSRNTWEVVNFSIVRGQYSHLLIAGSSDLFLTATGNGPSYLLQLNPNTLEEVNRKTPKGFDFLRMTMTPDQKSFYMYIHGSAKKAGRMRSFDQTIYPANKFCSDVRIEMSPGTQPIVINGYLFIRSNMSMTRFTLKNGSGCPRQKSQAVYNLDSVQDSGVAMACLNCLSIS